MSPSRFAVERMLDEAEIDIDDVLRAASDERIRAEFVRRGFTLHTADRREATGCFIEAEDLAEARSLLGPRRRIEALLVIERGLPRDFSGAFTPDALGRWPS